MLSKEIVERIKHIQLYTKRLMGGTRAGDYVTRQKGFGLEFDQIREYQQGDDVRYIDWKSTARASKMLVKQYYQEHSRTVMLIVDCSASLAFGSGKDTKYQCLATIACVLALVAQQSKDRVSLVLFSDDVHTYIPPRTGAGHVRKIMETVFEQEPGVSSRSSGRSKDPSIQFASQITQGERYGKTNYKDVFRFIGSKKTNDTIIFFLSDFIGLEDEPIMHSIARSCDFVVVRCLDTVERAIPEVGLLSVQDLETGEFFELDSRSSGLKELQRLNQERLAAQNKTFGHYGIDLFEATPNGDPVAELIRFFRKRMN